MPTPRRKAKATPETICAPARHVPVRTCIGCRRTAAPSELVRLVLDGDGQVVVDRAGSGRGAWLCADSAACFNEAVRRRAFGRAFRRPVAPEAVSLLTPNIRGVVGERERIESHPPSPAGAPLTRGKADR